MEWETSEIFLRKDKSFKLTDIQQNSFRALKDAFTKDHVLKMYYPVHAIELHSDISQYDYGTILLQKSPVDKKLHAVYYYSRKACDAKHKYPNYKLEALMIVITLKISVLFVRYRLIIEQNETCKSS